MIDKQSISAPPIFIIGVHRSGTTLLRFILSSHPDIYIPPESDFIPRFFLRYPNRELTQQQVEKLLKIIFEKYRFVGEWQGPPPDTNAFYKGLGDKTSAGFLNALYGMYAQQNHAVRWGDKTPIYASYVRLIQTIFPNAQFVHMLRDPRDVAVSILEKYQDREFHVDIYFAARNWVRRIQKAKQDGHELFPDRYIEIFYEDLVTNPKVTIQTVCDFLGEPYDPAMLSQNTLAREVIPIDSHFFSNVRQPITTARIGRWKENLTDRDIRLVQHVCGTLMNELGYTEVDLGSMGLFEWLRMQLLHFKYSSLQAGRRFLQVIGLVPPI
jgi:hypothetical protein